MPGFFNSKRHWPEFFASVFDDAFVGALAVD